MTRLKTPLTALTLRQERKDCGHLYRLLRARLGLTQRAMGRLMGCSRDSIAVRETRKRVYTLGELTMLQQVSGMSDTEWMDLLREIAK